MDLTVTVKEVRIHSTINHRLIFVLGVPRGFAPSTLVDDENPQTLKLYSCAF